MRQILHFRDFALFRDESQRPGQGVDRTSPLTEGLQEDVARSALLMALMSPHYLSSDWCARERAWWLEANGEGTPGPQGRIFVCRTFPNVTDLDGWRPDRDHQDWPDSFKDRDGHALTGFWFHSREQVDFATVPFRWEGTIGDREDYNKEMRELVRHMTRRLREMKRRQEEQAQEAADLAKLASRSQVIYLHARESQREAWADAKGQLGERGHIVFPSAPETLVTDPPLQPREIRARRNERIHQLANCDALLMLGTEPGLDLDTDLLAVAHRDRHSARDLSGKLLPCALLNQCGCEVPTAAQLAIEALDGMAPSWPDAFLSWLQASVWPERAA